MKLALYSVSYSGAWYDGKPLDIKGVIARAKRFGFEGIELAAKRPHANPMDLDRKARKEVMGMLADAGIELAAVASYCGFTSPFEEERELNQVMLREQIKLTSDLGCGLLRVFAAWPGVVRARSGVCSYELAGQYYEQLMRGQTGLEQWDFAVENLREAAKVAGDHGVVLLLQNHGPVVNSHRDMLDMIAEVGSSHVQACLDAPLLRPPDDADLCRRAVLETGKLLKHSHYGGEWHRRPGGTVELLPAFKTAYPAFVQALKDIGYRGYLSYELCHPCIRRHKYQGIEFVDRQVRMALEYMRDVVTNA